MKKVVQYLIGLLIGGTLLYFAFRGQDWNHIIQDIQKADYSWVFVGLVFSFLSHVLRGLRWQQLIEANDLTPKPLHTIASVWAGYLFNLVIPRGGEVSRCTLLNRSDRVPFATAMGTVLIDRTADTVVLLILFSGAFLMEGDRILTYFSFLSGNFGSMTMPLLGLLFLILGVGCFFLVRKFWWDTALVVKIRKFVGQMWSGMGSVFRLRRPGLFMLYTIGIWGCYYLTVLLPSFALEDTAGGPYLAFMVLVMGTVGVALPSPGGIGPYHAAVAFTYVAFGFNRESGNSFAIICHSSQTLLIILVGALSVMLLLGRAKFVENSGKAPESST